MTPIADAVLATASTKKVINVGVSVIYSHARTFSYPHPALHSPAIPVPLEEDHPVQRRHHWPATPQTVAFPGAQSAQLREERHPPIQYSNQPLISLYAPYHVPHAIPYPLQPTLPVY